jgi:hypothetical protein
VEHTRRTVEHWAPEDGPFDEWVVAWAAAGLVPEYPWDPPMIVVNQREVLVVALIDAEWLAAHPGWAGRPASRGSWARGW